MFPLRPIHLSDTPLRQPTSWPPLNSMWACRAATTVPLLSDSVSPQRNKEAGSPSSCQSSPAAGGWWAGTVGSRWLTSTTRCSLVKSQVTFIYKVLLTDRIFATCCSRNWGHKYRWRRGKKIRTFYFDIKLVRTCLCLLNLVLGNKEARANIYSLFCICIYLLPWILRFLVHRRFQRVCFSPTNSFV